MFGLLTKPLIRLLLPHPKVTTSMTTTEPSTPKSFIVPLLGNAQDSEADLEGHQIHRPNSIRALLATPTHTVHRLWRKFDDSFMRPVFGGRGFVPVEPGSPSERNGQQWHWEEKARKCCNMCCILCMICEELSNVCMHKKLVMKFCLVVWIVSARRLASCAKQQYLFDSEPLHVCFICPQLLPPMNQ